MKYKLLKDQKLTRLNNLHMLNYSLKFVTQYYDAKEKKRVYGCPLLVAILPLSRQACARTPRTTANVWTPRNGYRFSRHAAGYHDWTIINVNAECPWQFTVVKKELETRRCNGHSAAMASERQARTWSRGACAHVVLLSKKTSSFHNALLSRAGSCIVCRRKKQTTTKLVVTSLLNLVGFLKLSSFFLLQKNEPSRSN